MTDNLFTPPIVQVALDFTNVDDALRVADLAVKAGVDWLEAGTPLIIAEGEFHYGSIKDGSVLPGSIKLGAWNHLGRFDDLRLSVGGISTADPSSSGIPLRRRGNDGIAGNRGSTGAGDAVALVAETFETPSSAGTC